MDEHNTHRSIKCGRKRAFPTSYRRAFKLASAVTLSASFLATVAFQQSTPLGVSTSNVNFHRNPHSHSPPSSSTAIHVLTNPTNLVRIERKQTVQDRAALEELYLLSSLAKKAMVKTKGQELKRKRRKRKVSVSVSSSESESVATSSSKSSASVVANNNKNNNKKKRITASTTLLKKKNTATKEKSVSKAKIARPAPTPAAATSAAAAAESEQPAAQLIHSPAKASQHTQTHTQKPAGPNRQNNAVLSHEQRVQFRGLSTVPNRRNGKKKKTLDPTRIDSLDLDTDEYIRTLLRKKDEFLSYDTTQNNHGSKSLAAETDAELAELELDTTPVVQGETESKASLQSNHPPNTKQSIHTNIVYNSKSSTMPGLRQRTNTDRQIAHRNGVRIAQQHAGIEFKETAAAKTKRRQASGQSMYRASRSVPDSLVQFANEIHNVDRITPKEEIALGEKTQAALKLQRIYDGLVTKLDREPTDDEWCAAAGKFNMESIAQTIEEGLEAKDRLVTSNLRMVQGVVNVYIKNGLQGQYNAGDLMQEGIVALIRAAEKFDPTKGFRFSTYAMYWIRAAVKRDQLYQSRVIQVPQRLHENSKRIEVCRKELTETLDHPPSVSEVSQTLGMTTAQIERCDTAIAQRICSLDQQIVNRNKPMITARGVESLHSIIASQADDGESQKLDLIHLREDLLKALKCHLTEEEASIITLRFGMDEEYASSKKAGRTISEVGDIMELKPDKVRRIILRSLKKLRMSIGEDFEYYNRDFSM